MQLLSYERGFGVGWDKERGGGMKTLEVTMVCSCFCEYFESPGSRRVLCSECEYNCGYKHDLEGNLCVECGYNKELQEKYQQKQNIIATKS